MLNKLNLLPVLKISLHISHEYKHQVSQNNIPERKIDAFDNHLCEVDEAGLRNDAKGKGAVLFQALEDGNRTNL